MFNLEEVKYLFIITCFVILVLLFFVVSFVVIFKKRQNELLLKNQLDEERFKTSLLTQELESNRKLEKERERISLDIHDDLGASLSAIKLKAEYIKNMSGNREVETTLSEIAKSTHDISFNMREMMWSLTGGNDTLDSFVIYTKKYVHDFFEYSSIQAQLSIPIIVEDRSMSGLIRRNLFLIVKESCQNILKHSQASKMLFEIILNRNELILEISDNGIGIPKDHKQGNGLYSISKRAQSMDALFDVKRLEKGTLCSITLCLVD